MTAQILTLASFLAARLDDDEAAALAAMSAENEFAGSFFGDTASDAVLGLADSEGADPRITTHFARHDPARVLAEVAAKRQILDAHEDARQAKDVYNRGHEAGDLTTADDLRFRLDANVRWAALDRTLHVIAAVYSDHPDYDERWRP